MLPAYAEDRARSDHRSIREAERNARKQIPKPLPDGSASKGRCSFNIAVADSRGTVGRCWLYIDAGNNDAFVYDIAINPASRIDGDGTRAMQALGEAARQSGCRQFGLNVFVHSAGAQAFYATLGFTSASIYMNKALPPPLDK